MQHKCESRESNQEEGGEQMKTHRITPAYIHYTEAPNYPRSGRLILT
jgi:hypothetical protein